MCRFILVKSEEKISSKIILEQFSGGVRKTKTLDGDMQEDGWGYAWLENDEWKTYKSLLPIWEDVKQFNSFPKSSTFLAHARSASFPAQKGIIEFNQPYISKDYAFVFNGLLKGVSLPNVPGKIGAEKIWNMVQKELQNNSPEIALENVYKTIAQNTREIMALNIGLADRKNIYSKNVFSNFPEYYALQKKSNKNLHAIYSEGVVINI